MSYAWTFKKGTTGGRWIDVVLRTVNRGEGATGLGNPSFYPNVKYVRLVSGNPGYELGDIPLSSGNWVEVNGTSRPGLYLLKLPANIDSGTCYSVTITISGTTPSGTDIVTRHIRIGILGCDFYDSARLGLTSLPYQSPGTPGGLLVIGTGQYDINPSYGNVGLTPAERSATADVFLEKNLEIYSNDPRNVVGVALYRELTYVNPWNIDLTDYNVANSAAVFLKMIPYIKGRTDLITGGMITVVPPIDSGNVIRIYAGNSYDNIEWKYENGLSTDTFKFYAFRPGSTKQYNCMYNIYTKKIILSLSSEQTRELGGQDWDYVVTRTPQGGSEQIICSLRGGLRVTHYNIPE